MQHDYWPMCDDRPMAKSGSRGEAAEIMDSIRRVVHALRSSHRAASDVELTGAQLFVLATLRAAEEPMGVKELAELTRTDQSTVSVVVGRLVDRGLVRRQRSSIDSRRVELSLTPRGRRVLAKTPTTVAQQKLADALSRLSSADSAALLRILKRVVEMMGESDAPAPMLFDGSDEQVAVEEMPGRKRKRPPR
jgi:DNA-binding MarR family transcriptional regulator